MWARSVLAFSSLTVLLTEVGAVNEWVDECSNFYTTLDGCSHYYDYPYDAIAKKCEHLLSF